MENPNNLVNSEGFESMYAKFIFRVRDYLLQIIYLILMIINLYICEHSLKMMLIIRIEGTSAGHLDKSHFSYPTYRVNLSWYFIGFTT